MSESIGTPSFKKVTATEPNGIVGDGSLISVTASTNESASLSGIFDSVIKTSNAANQAKTAVQNALNGAVLKDQVGKISGVVGIDTNGRTSVPGALDVYGQFASFGLAPNTSAQFRIGPPGASNQWQRLQFFSGSAASADTWSDVTLTAMGGTGNNDGSLSIGATDVSPATDNATSLGMASDRFSGIFLASSPNVTSDASDKTIIGEVGAAGYVEGLAVAQLWNELKPKIYALKQDGRHHVGLIAQDVQQALTRVGIDPATFGMWGQDDLTHTINVTDKNGHIIGHKIEPVMNADGSQATRQSLRYDEITISLLAGAKIALEALTARVAALEGKSGTANAS